MVVKIREFRNKRISQVHPKLAELLIKQNRAEIVTDEPPINLKKTVYSPSSRVPRAGIIPAKAESPAAVAIGKNGKPKKKPGRKKKYETREIRAES